MAFKLLSASIFSCSNTLIYRIIKGWLLEVNWEHRQGKCLKAIWRLYTAFLWCSSCIVLVKGAHVMHARNMHKECCYTKVMQCKYWLAVHEIKVQICDQYQKSPAKTWEVYIANAYSHGIVIPLPGFWVGQVSVEEWELHVINTAP